jgi:uncharacterized membrane protein YfhO
VLLPEGAPDGYIPGGSPYVSTAEITSYVPERITVRADAAAPGWLVLGEWAYPGWRARVDGQPQDVYRADYGLRAVPLEAGEHTVEFVYRPASFYVGAAASIVMLSAVMVLMLLPGRRRQL